MSEHFNVTEANRKQWATRLTAIFLLAFIWLTMCGGVCEMVPESEPVRIGDLYGGYEANFHMGKVDSLYLFPDSTYIRVYVTGDGRRYVDSGSWTFRDRSGITVSRRFEIRFPTFISRFNLDSAYTDQPLGYQTGIADSVAGPVSTGVWKTTWKDTFLINIGGPYKPAWVKE